MNNPFGLGAHESKKDYRDIKLSDVTSAVPLPDSYMIDISQEPVTMQYKRGSCVAHSTSKRKEKIELDDRKVYTALSPRFLYSVIKNNDGDSNEGTAIRNGLKLLTKVGCCTESTYPSDYPDMLHSEFMDYSKIPPQAFIEAKDYMDKSYAIVDTSNPTEIQQAIMQGNGVIARLVLDNQWWTPSWEAKDVLPVKPPKTSVLGGHAVWIYGWDNLDEKLAFHFRNSWSDKWGNQGNGWFYYEDYKNFFTEAWTSIDIPNVVIEKAKKLPPPDITPLLIQKVKLLQELLLLYQKLLEALKK